MALRGSQVARPEASCVHDQLLDHHGGVDRPELERVHARVQPVDPGWLDLGYSVTLLDTSRARSVLGWSPGYTLEQGLAETVDWYRRYLAD